MKEMNWKAQPHLKMLMMAHLATQLQSEETRNRRELYKKRDEFGEKVFHFVRKNDESLRNNPAFTLTAVQQQVAFALTHQSDAYLSRTHVMGLKYKTQYSVMLELHGVFLGR
tara:strand:- start:6171 stop:6506 length:336 start_codon:yes stop_codon:yes gene_type:complete